MGFPGGHRQISAVLLTDLRAISIIDEERTVSDPANGPGAKGLVPRGNISLRNGHAGGQPPDVSRRVKSELSLDDHHN